MDNKLYLPGENRKNRKGLCLLVSVVLALLLTGSIARGQQVQAKVGQAQKDLAKEVFRFHVLANSDSEEDQELKLKVRDAVLSYMKEQIPESESAVQTKEWAQEHLNDIENIGEDTVKANGYSYKVDAEVAVCDFPDKSYGDVTFPAGKYEALRIKIGSAKGHNWWCVLYPNLCFMDSVHAVVPKEGKDELKQVLGEDEYEMVTASSDFKIKWFFFGGDKEK